MAAAISVHNMLQRMGLSLEAATEVVNVNGQNLSVLEDFLQLEDKDVETLCRVIRRPGGVNAAGNQNQGMQVLAMAEANSSLVVLAYLFCGFLFQLSQRSFDEELSP